MPASTMPRLFLSFVFALALALMFSGTPVARADTGNTGPWGDQGDGSYKNPVLPGDFPDLDVLRVGPDYYAISSTDQFAPGMLIMHSRDLVNWQIIGHVASDLTQISKELNWDKMNRTGRGIWAGSIRYHEGKYWVYFFTPDDGLFMTTAKDPAGPWEPLYQVWNVAGWDDCCPFWDDDGQGYLIATHVSEGYEIRIFRMSPDSRNLLLGSDKVIRQSKGTQGNKLYKINGMYYHFFSDFVGDDRVLLMGRSKNIYGPYETKQIQHVSKSVDREPNQGGLVQSEAGDWWLLTHQGTIGWEGRPASLLPITWISGWPIPGKPGPDGLGTMVWTNKKPVLGAPVALPQGDDEFDAATLSPQWEWICQPRKEKFSLTERPGFLRLHAFKPVPPGGLPKAGNTLTQRAMRTAKNEAITKLDISGMANGQQTGLCHLSAAYCTLGVSQASGVRTLIFNDTGGTTVGPPITVNTLWLKSTWDETGHSQFEYSLDGTTFTTFGKPYSLSAGNYRGDRIGIYCYNTDTDAGYVDVDWFHYTIEGPPVPHTIATTQPSSRPGALP